MTNSINGINNSNTVNSQKLSLEYDFNKDGKVDIEDYNFASNSEEILDKYSQTKLDKIFKDVISSEKSDSEDLLSTENAQDNVAELQKALKELKNETGEKIYNQELASSTLTGKSISELKAMQKQINQDLKRLENKLENLNQEKISVEQEQKSAKNNYDNAKEDYEDTATSLSNENEYLQNMVSDYQNVQNIIVNLNSNIQDTKAQYETNYKNKVNSTKNSAETEYNAKQDGDYKTFVNNKIGSISKESSELTSLNASAESYNDQASTMLSNIDIQSLNVQNLVFDLDNSEIKYESAAEDLNSANEAVTKNADEITETEGDIATDEAAADAVEDEIASRIDGASLTGAEVLSKISDAEKQLAKDNNIDLTTCMIAKGADGNFHIYDSNGTSLARTYGSNGGYDVVPCGSGYMRNMQKSDDAENARAVYKFSSVNEDMTDGEACWDSYCYCTCSPLSFDVDGDGFKTSDTTMNYDIDGDGKLDKINNSSEWVLAFDKDGDGKVGTDGSELFGNNTDLNNDGKADGYKDGFEALKALAKQEGLISENDNVLDTNDLKKLNKEYGLTMTQGYNGESKSFEELGITQINIAQTSETKMNKNFDGKHNDLMTQNGATFVVNGQTRDYADLWNAKQTEVDTPIVINKDDTSSVTIYDTDVNINTAVKEAAKKSVVQTYETTSALLGEINYEMIVNNAKKGINNYIPKAA